MNKLFLQPNDPLLTKVAKKVPASQIDSPETRENIKQMLEVAYRQQKDKKKPVMMGLAAPQIGISKRIILVDLKADGKGRVGDLRVYINPEITWVSKREGEWYEGCFSTGRVCGIVKRPISVKVKASKLQTRSVNSNTHQEWRFKVIEERHTGYVARIFQHEIDHLNGKVFVDLIKDPNKLHWVLKKEFPLYRNKQAWRTWPKKCPFER
ncbi:peptide deformylase [Candidatus Microgenomates bacterium]|nr:peptide deformylase [Candidatus Microgenomates bacterium]